MASSPLLLTALLFGASLGATAQTQVTWGAVSYVFHGEKTPDIVANTYNLTTIGAHQLQSAGEVLRARYVSGSSANDTRAYPIQGLNSNSLDNSQLFIQSTDDEYVGASAQAFMQGLYPPVGATGQGNQILGNGSLEMYPLNGYQYASISTVSTMDYNYIWVSGNIGCTNYEINHAEYLYSTESEELYENTASFYASLESSVFWPWDSSVVNYENAYALYEYALYESIHNGTVLNTLSDADLSTLYTYASTQQFAMNSGNTNTSSSIAGATLAAKVIEMFGHNIASAGGSDKLTLLFGSYEPFLSFFSLSGLSTAYQYNTRFTTLPLHGSLMTFELFSYSDSSSTSVSFPPTDELYVRFLFRNGTDDSAPILSYPLFGRGESQTDMSYADFMNGMSNFAMTDAATWCETCGSITLFCEAFASDSTYISTGPSKSSNQMKPWVAGIIGAVVTLAVCILAGIALAILRGARIGFQSRRSSLGGFKGAEKMQSDADLPKTGAGATVVRHERVGSWELSDADKKRDAGMDRVVSGADYSRRSEDGIGNANPFGDGVKALDQV